VSNSEESSGCLWLGCPKLGYATALLLGLRIRIPPLGGCLSLCVFYVLSGVVFMFQLTFSGYPS